MGGGRNSEMQCTPTLHQDGGFGVTILTPVFCSIATHGPNNAKPLGPVATGRPTLAAERSFRNSSVKITMTCRSGFASVRVPKRERRFAFTRVDDWRRRQPQHALTPATILTLVSPCDEDHPGSPPIAPPPPCPMRPSRHTAQARLGSASAGSAPLDLKLLNRFRNSIRLAFLSSARSFRIESSELSEQGKLEVQHKTSGRM